MDGARSARDTLVGMDLDAAALAAARARLPRSILSEGDSLLRADAKDPASSMKQAFGGAVDGVILNPPWGASIRHSTSSLRAAGYELASGQFDSADLFVELALRVLRRDGTAVFILPDSLFQLERAALRRMLVKRTRLRLVARLGEGLFPQIFRGVAVVVASNSPPDDRHSVLCMRLRAHHRRAVLDGTATLADLERSLAHPVLQARFGAAAGHRFDVDVRERDRAVLARLEAAPKLPWSTWLESGRGVELSKHGRIVRCTRCGVAAPAPRKPRLVECSGCGGRSHATQRDVTEIVRPLAPNTAPTPGWAPLIAGEDVERYFGCPSRQIKLRVAGISYKDPALYTSRKLLIRKTGVGLMACIDETGSLTTQVVFHYVKRERAGAPAFLLDYLLGMLNSRVLLAYHLVTNGDLEWRSHPYVTQRVIESLPIPAVQQGSSAWKQAAAIASAVRRRGQSAAPGSKPDLEVDALVAGMYGLSVDDCVWVASILRRAGDLQAIRSLRFAAGELRPKVVPP